MWVVVMVGKVNAKVFGVFTSEDEARTAERDLLAAAPFSVDSVLIAEIKETW